MKKLILGYLPKDYNPEKYIVLGPWSFIDNQDLLINGAIFEDDPYNNHLETKSDAELSLKISKYLISLFAQKLNKHNNTSYSNKYWRVMLSAWVSMLVQITIERYRRIERLIHKYPTDKFKVDLVECNEDWFFNDSLDFVNKGVFDILFNEWIFSFIIKESFSDQFEINNQSICQIVKEDKHTT